MIERTLFHIFVKSSHVERPNVFLNRSLHDVARQTSLARPVRRCTHV